MNIPRNPAILKPGFAALLQSIVLVISINSYKFMRVDYEKCIKPSKMGLIMVDLLQSQDLYA